MIIYIYIIINYTIFYIDLLRGSLLVMNFPFFKHQTEAKAFQSWVQAAWNYWEVCFRENWNQIGILGADFPKKKYK